MEQFRSLTSPDLTKAVQITDEIWWVGHHLENDVFQCHVYLLAHGDQSVLFDPGSQLTFEHTLEKIEQVTAFSNIRYFVCHHQDPDITGALSRVTDLVDREDAVIVTHWRAEMLIKHYGDLLPFFRVEENNWELDLGGRNLKFVFTPYAHFPGAFCTFDENSGVLFSSDLFGGYSETFSLLAQGEEHFENIRPFHEHYIPSRDILAYAMSRISELPVRLIAPQHGSIIPENLVSYMVEKLKRLDCGLYLMAKQSTDIHRLSKLNRTLRELMRTLVLDRDFRDIARNLLNVVRNLLPAESLEFYAQLSYQEVLLLAPESRYRGLVIPPPALVQEAMETSRNGWLQAEKRSFRQLLPEAGETEGARLLVPLFARGEQHARGVAVIRLSEPIEIGEDIERVMEEMTPPLQVAVEREAIYRSIDMERRKFYERSIRDPLTGLLTRFYMTDVMHRLFEIHNRDARAAVALLMIDIDNFKSFNDSFGHNSGDEVLRLVAGVLMGCVRSGDVAVRLGGEEFGVFAMTGLESEVHSLAERLRERVLDLKLDGPMAAAKLTVSIGTAIRRQHESLNNLIERADVALYEAKRHGRNRVCTAPE